MITAKPDNRGLTLIEILVVLGIATLVGFYTLIALRDSLLVYNRQRREAKLSQDLRQGMLTLTEVVREGSGVSASSSGHTLGDYTLIISRPSVDCEGKIIRDATGFYILFFDTYIYYLDESNAANHVLKQKVIPDTQSCRQNTDGPLVEHVQNKKDSPVKPIFADSTTGLTPTVGTKSVIIRVVLQDVYRSYTVKADTTTVVTLRNPAA